MKALLILIAIAAGVWLLKRNHRRAAAPPPQAPRAPDGPAGSPQPMLRCARCGVHLPASDALPGHAGRAYCCAAHRRELEGA